MRLIGAAALSADPVLQELQSATYEGLAAFVFSDGSDVTGVFADKGENADDVIRLASKVIPGMQA